MAIEKKWVAGPGGVPVIDPSTANADYARATAPAPISTPTSTVDTTPVVSRYKSELTDYLNKMPPMPTEESMAKTRQDYRNQAQAQIDAITATYANKLKTATTEGEGRLGQTRAIGARRGLLGSPMAEAQKEQTTKYNEQVIGAIEAQKQQEIGLIFDKFDQRAQEAINQQKNEAITGANTYLNYLKENQAEARSDFQIIAKSKKIASLNLFSSVDIENWQKQTGWDDFMLQTVFDINKPSAQQIDWDKRVIGNTLIWSGIDPVTGQLKTITKELPAKLEATKYESIVTPDGTLIFYNPTDPNDIKTYGVEGQYAKPEKNANEIRTLSPGQTLVDANGKVIYSVPEDEDNKTVNVSPGQSVINPKTGEIIYTAPAKPKVKTIGDKETAGAKFKISTTQKSDLIGIGLSNDEINAIETNINGGYNIEQILQGSTGIDETTKKKVREVFTGTSTEKINVSNLNDTDFETAYLAPYTDENDELDISKLKPEIILEAKKRGYFDETDEKTKSWLNKAISWLNPFD